MIRKIILLILLFIYPICSLDASKWEDWELGGELGFAVGSGSKSGRLLSPGAKATLTKLIEKKFMELAIGYMYGSEITENYSKELIDEANFEDNEIDEFNQLISEAEQDVKIRLSVIPMTVNFYYTVFESFYAGGGIGLYHIFYKKEPLGDYRANIDSAPGEIVKSPATTALGFQQMVGIQIFPMSKKWSWFVGAKSFITTSGGPAGSIFGITFGGKVRYSW